MGHGGIGCRVMGEKLLATGTGKAGRTPPPAQRMCGLVNRCKRNSASHGIGAGSLRCVDETVDYAARGSRESTAC